MLSKMGTWFFSDLTIKGKIMSKIEELSPLALAFIGDAVHTLFVREQILNGKKDTLNTYNNNSKKFCNAQSQADALEKIFSELSEEEQEIVRRARNTKPKHHAKNFDEKTYNKATSFETLVGYLYLSQQYDRLNELLSKTIIMEEK